MTRRPPSSTPTYTLFPYPTLFRSGGVDRHTALRSGFHWDLKDHPFQVVHRLSALPIARHDWNGAANWRAQLDALLAQDRDQAFDIKKPPLMRLALVRLAPARHCIVWTRHHQIGRAHV